MTRVALYARFSTDMQSESSVDDQMRVTSERAEREGWRVVEKYADRGISGASMMRPAIQKLMLDAAERKFDIVIAEALDRLSRDQEDVAGIYKRLQYYGIKILTLSEGEINEMHIGLKGTMNALFLKDLVAKTKRGMRGRVENGKIASGLSYGYKMIRRLNDQGEIIRGEREVDPEQAAIIHRIFAEYATGKSPEAIAKDLNKEGIIGISGKHWSPSTINGNRKRGLGILNNELYIGRIVWNRQRFVKDPDTGKRQARPNDPSEWIKKEAPELRIIEQELWDRVKERQIMLDSKGKLAHKQRPQLLLSGLMKCGCCGSSYVKISRTQYGCFAARKMSTCDNFSTIRQEAAEKAVLDALQNHLMDPRLCDVFCDEYARYITEMHRAHNDSLANHRAELKRRQKEDAKMVQAIIDGFASPELKIKMNANTARMEHLQATLEKTEEVPALLEPSMARHYRNEVKNLIATLNVKESRREAAEMLRGLIDKITVTPKECGCGVHVDLHGSLAGILSIAAGNKTNAEKNELIQQVKSVAEGCDRLTSDVQNVVVVYANRRFKLSK